MQLQIHKLLFILLFVITSTTANTNCEMCNRFLVFGCKILKYVNIPIESCLELLYSNPPITVTEGISATNKPLRYKRMTQDSKTTIPTDNSKCPPTITKIGCQQICSGDLIFEDNFDTLDWDKWQPEIRIPTNKDDGEFVSYQNRPEIRYVSNGVLNIVPNLLTEVPDYKDTNIARGYLNLTSSEPNMQCTGIEINECKFNSSFGKIIPPIVSARIRTKGAFEFLYGRIEVRAKLPIGDWLFPLILLEPSERAYGASNYSSGQMRVAFARGNKELIDIKKRDISGRMIMGGAVLSVGEHVRGRMLGFKNTPEHIGNKFHNFTLTWTDTYIAMGMDGQEYGRLNGPFYNLQASDNIRHARLWKHRNSKMAPFDKNFYITLGVAVGGHSDFPGDSTNSALKEKKPWINMAPNAALTFWKKKDQWYPSWTAVDSGLQVDYVRVYAL